LKNLLRAAWLALVFTTAHAAPMADLSARDAAKQMGVGINIGNTLDNTTRWETGWGNPPITKAYIDRLAALGFKVVRLPVAWDTYAKDGRIPADKLARVGEITDWITGAGMFCVINIHWDGGWIDKGKVFGAEAERKYPGYWTQIASYLADRGERVVFEALNEETAFEGAGSTRRAFATLTHVNQLFVDTVRHTGGNNAKRLLVVTGYATDFAKTASADYVLPKDSVPDKLLISVHYYTPWPFVGMTKDESWGRMRATWGTRADYAELEKLFDLMQAFSERNDIPVFVGEFNASDRKETASRIRWMVAAKDAALKRGMVPVLWETGFDIKRRPPFEISEALRGMLAADGGLSEAQ
jgi:endoglucanase